MRRIQHMPVPLALAAAASLLAGCGKAPERQKCPWTASKIAVLGGFDGPECALADPQAGTVYVGNMSPTPNVEGGAKYWGDDGTGFVSTMSPDGKMISLRWAVSSGGATFHSPKGLCLVGKTLWAADNHQLITIDTSTAKVKLELDLPGAKKLNDMVSDGTHAFVSDTETGRITRLGPDGPHHMKGPPGANGLAFRAGKLYCVSWSEHEVYEIDLTGAAEAKALGLAKHFKNLDGIEFLPDGSFLVSDQPNDRIAWVSAEGHSVETLVKVGGPADFGIDLKRGRMYVPC
ncbi:MAG: hypothetical protein ACYTFI_14235, partial [Planctomycetota bacterium]